MTDNSDAFAEQFAPSTPLQRISSMEQTKELINKYREKAEIANQHPVSFAITVTAADMLDLLNMIEQFDFSLNQSNSALVSAREALGELDEPFICDAITRLKTALRKTGGCSAVSYDGMHCQLQHGHQRSHETTSGSTCSWPDKERNEEKSKIREKQIWESLLRGYAWQPYRESFGDDD